MNMVKNMKENADYFHEKMEKGKQLYQQDYQEDNFIEPRYNIFLKYVQSNSKRFVESIKSENSNLDFKIFGIELKKEFIIENFGEDIFEKACKEVQIKERPNYSPTLDFAKAKIKLVCLYDIENDSFKPIINLDYVRKLLQFEDISFQIDYENNYLHIEEITPKLK